MKEVLKIEGGHKLNGTVRISSAKNATVALIPASILAEGPITIVGVPEIADVASLALLLKELNVEVHFPSKGHMIIDPSKMESLPLASDNVNKLRASYYFMGALLGKYKEVKIKMPGGCDLGPRPIDLHLKGFEALGAKINYEKGSYYLKADRLIGNKIYLDIASVGATINIMLAAVYAEGRTIIENAAKEPEVIDVATLLNKMGAHVRGAGTGIITIDGVEHLHGCFHEIIPDRIEAGTYMIMAAAAAKEVRIENVIPQHLEALISKLQEMGVELEVGVDYVIIRGGKPLQGVDIKTLPYPGFATDLQQPLTTLLSIAEGRSKVTETIYVSRFKHCEQLGKMGADIEVNIPVAHIHGGAHLQGTSVEATDLRCGASLVIAGLIAEGVTEIDGLFHIDRGYDDLQGKLVALGAKVWRETVE
ncbi:MAG: UDP-N-acetylglucosamine 1-carboxyvinyltransferase [Erysipelotrichaceae bacterium]|nr:UDP-N-acetylglucosamine 1-carboxyvinyltransferase [Erysipelotrichaceae bacterium]MBQ9987916.1 UDP-N-acetylglucosamine 1-carboxyvinyltransferase [Erysipelotrichales bacterium]